MTNDLLQTVRIELLRLQAQVKSLSSEVEQLRRDRDANVIAPPAMTFATLSGALTAGGTATADRLEFVSSAWTAAGETFTARDISGAGAPSGARVGIVSYEGMNVVAALGLALYLGKTDSSISKSTGTPGTVSRYSDFSTDTGTNDSVYNIFATSVGSSKWCVYVLINGVFIMVAAEC